MMTKIQVLAFSSNSDDTPIDLKIGINTSISHLLKKKRFLIFKKKYFFYQFIGIHDSCSLMYILTISDILK